MRDVDTLISFSPDGNRFVFMRGDPAQGKYHIVTANTDGGDVRILATRKAPLESQFVGPAWSPEGKTIAASAIDYRNGLTYTCICCGEPLYNSETGGIPPTNGAGNRICPQSIIVNRQVAPEGKLSLYAEAFHNFNSGDCSTSRRGLARPRARRRGRGHVRREGFPG